MLQDAWCGAICWLKGFVIAIGKVKKGRKVDADDIQSEFREIYVGMRVICGSPAFDKIDNKTSPAAPSLVNMCHTLSLKKEKWYSWPLHMTNHAHQPFAENSRKNSQSTTAGNREQNAKSV